MKIKVNTFLLCPPWLQPHLPQVHEVYTYRTDYPCYALSHDYCHQGWQPERPFEQLKTTKALR